MVWYLEKSLNRQVNMINEQLSLINSEHLLKTMTI